MAIHVANFFTMDVWRADGLGLIIVIGSQNTLDEAHVVSQP